MSKYKTVSDNPIDELVSLPPSLPSPTISKKKLLILTPCYGSQVHVSYMISLINTFNYFRDNYDTYQVEVGHIVCNGDSLITRARNNLIAKAMNDPQMTHIIFIDSDISWAPIEIVKLLNANKDIVGGVYPLKYYNWDKVVEFSNSTVPALAEIRKRNPIANETVPDQKLLKSQILQYNMNTLPEMGAKLEIVNNLAEVRLIATGFMMLTRTMLEQMMLAHPTTKYVDDVRYLTEVENQFAYALFDCSILGGHYLSEDWTFCERWRNMGGHVYMDVTIALTHTGTEEYAGCFILSV